MRKTNKDKLLRLQSDRSLTLFFRAPAMRIDCISGMPPHSIAMDEQMMIICTRKNFEKKFLGKARNGKNDVTFEHSPDQVSTSGMGLHA